MIEHEEARVLEVVAIEGVDTVRVIINGIAYSMPSAAAKMLAKDLTAAVKRVKGK